MSFIKTCKKDHQNVSVVTIINNHIQYDSYRDWSVIWFRNFKINDLVVWKWLMAKFCSFIQNSTGVLWTYKLFLCKTPSGLLHFWTHTGYISVVVQTVNATVNLCICHKHHCDIPAVSTSTQPSKLHGMASECQRSVWVIHNGDGKHTWKQPTRATAHSRVCWLGLSTSTVTLSSDEQVHYHSDSDVTTPA